MENKYELDKDGIPKDNTVYKEKEYWDYRFEKEQQYDWISSIEKMDENCQGLLDFIVKHASIDNCLNLGCGNSTLGQTLISRGVKKLVNCDYSETVIYNMKQKYKDTCGEWVVADITNLKQNFKEEEFQFIIEKCTIDALTVDPGDPWNPDQNLRDSINKVLNGIYHILRKDGLFVSISFDQPHFRRKYFTDWDQFFKINLRNKFSVGLSECYVYEFTKL